MITDVIALPIGEHLSETDDNSVAILLTYGTARVLLAGDAEGRKEEYMASNRSLLSRDQPYCAQHPAECR